VQLLGHVQCTVGSRRHATNICKKKTPTTCSYCLSVDLFVYGFFSCSQANRRGTQPLYNTMREDCDPLHSGGRFVWHHELCASNSIAPQLIWTSDISPLLACSSASSPPWDSDRHDESPMQVKDKTEPSRRPLSFSPNFKLPHARNHHQFDSHWASVCQP